MTSACPADAVPGTPMEEFDDRAEPRPPGRAPAGGGAALDGATRRTDAGRGETVAAARELAEEWP
jgi:hypothetical protein